MTHDVTHQSDQHRYVISSDGEQLGRADYRIERDAIVFTHTEINQDRQEKGLAAQLVQFALDDVRASSDRRVVAECSFVAHWIQTHPDYQELLER